MRVWRAMGLHTEVCGKVLVNATAYVLPVLAMGWVLPHTPVTTAALSGVLAVVNIGLCMSAVLHRYFAHAAFRTSRPFQFLLGVVGCLAFQGGPIWWASKHRRHHAHCDTPHDPHSWAATSSFWYAWWGWTLAPSEQRVDYEYVRAWLAFPELVLLDQVWFAAPATLWLIAHHAVGTQLTVACVVAPMFFSRMITLLFNCEYHPPQTHATCKAIDSRRILAELVGESYHADHHVHPRRLRRPGVDLPFWLVLKPLLATGLIWD